MKGIEHKSTEDERDERPKTALIYLAEIDNLRWRLEAANIAGDAILEQLRHLQNEIERLRKVYKAAVELIGYKTDAAHLMNIWQRFGERIAGLLELAQAVEEYREYTEIQDDRSTN